RTTTTVARRFVLARIGTVRGLCSHHVHSSAVVIHRVILSGCPASATLARSSQSSYSCSNPVTSIARGLFQEAGDQAPGDAEGGRPVLRVGHPVDVEPAGRGDLRLLYSDLTPAVTRDDPDPELAWKRPGLASEVADVLHLNAAPLAHLAGDRLFQRLARLDEPGQ